MEFIKVEHKYAIDSIGSYFIVILFNKFWFKLFLSDIKVVSGKYPLWYKILRMIYKK